jgi:hypothetical protein
MEFVAAPHERLAELGKRMHDTEHCCDDATKTLSQSSSAVTARLATTPALDSR